MNCPSGTVVVMKLLHILNAFFLFSVSRSDSPLGCIQFSSSSSVKQLMDCVAAAFDQAKNWIHSMTKSSNLIKSNFIHFTFISSITTFVQSSKFNFMNAEWVLIFLKSSNSIEILYSKCSIIDDINTIGAANYNGSYPVEDMLNLNETCARLKHFLTNIYEERWGANSSRSPSSRLNLFLRIGSNRLLKQQDGNRPK